ncbi:MAG: cytidylate kinase-like family protein [bacterium]
MNKLIERAIQQSQSNKVVKLQIKSEWKPDIVISRAPGSGGAIIAKKIAKKLNWQFFDKNLMFKLSEKLGILTAELRKIDEHDRTWFADTFQSLFNPSYVSDIRYINHLKKILLHAAKEGDLIILGRGANYIIPPDKCLRVRVTASFQTRIDNTYKYENVKTKQEAFEHVRHTEDQRSRFIRQYFGANPHNPWNYDLVISTDNFSLDQATDLIIEAFLTKFPKERKHLASKLS